MLLRAKNLHKKYGDASIFQNLDFEIDAGKIISISGQSGSGKTTLLNILGTIDKPDLGQLTIDGKNMEKLLPRKLALFRNNHIGFIFQFHNLLPEFTGFENVLIPSIIYHKETQKKREKVIELLKVLQIHHCERKKPAQMSGGERQRVAIARALVNDPLIVFADEPTGNLDVHNTFNFFEVIRDLQKKFGQTFLLATHNKSLAESADVLYELKAGKLKKI